jgi:Type II secretion system (T2SS), protein E, N-terminal domain
MSAVNQVSTPTKWSSWTARCSNPACNRKRLMPNLFRTYVGIHLGKQWFCSPECFEAFLQNTITAAISSQQLNEPPKARRMPLGLLLLQRGVLNSDQLALVRAKQQTDGINLGCAAQELGFATAEQVTAAVAAQWSCPVFSLGARSLTYPVHVPRRLLEQYEMLPVHFVEADKRLMMGFVTGVQYQVLSTIENITGCDALPCFITAKDYYRCLRAIPASPENQTIFETPTPTAEISRLGRNYVSQLGAQAVRLGMCRDYLWMRIWSNQGQIDLLFRVQLD